MAITYHISLKKSDGPIISPITFSKKWWHHYHIISLKYKYDDITVIATTTITTSNTINNDNYENNINNNENKNIIFYRINIIENILIINYQSII